MAMGIIPVREEPGQPCPICSRKRPNIEVTADNMAWVFSEAQKVLGKTPHLWLLPALLKEVGIVFSDGEAA